MKKKSSQAVVITIRDIGEGDLLVELFTEEEGRISGVAKAARKSKRRFVNTFDMGHLITVLFYRPRGRGLYLIEDAVLIDDHPNMTGLMKEAAYTSFMLELVSLLTTLDEANRGLFHILSTFIALMDATPRREGSRETSLLIYTVRVLKEVGIPPLLTRCVRCGREGPGKGGGLFIPRVGGMVCGGCLESRDRGVVFPEGIIEGLTSALTIPIREFCDMKSIVTIDFRPSDKKNLRETRSGIFAFLNFQLGKKMKSMDFIERYIDKDR